MAGPRWSAFFDETSPQTTDNSRRVWGFTPPAYRTKGWIRANTFGFYALNGESVLRFKSDSRTESVCEMLDAIRAENPDRPLVVVLDNFASYTANATRERAEALDIHLVYLPRYSPHLNPLEQVWKRLKRALSPASVPDKAAFLRDIHDEFFALTPRVSFATEWINRFLDVNRLTG